MITSWLLLLLLLLASLAAGTVNALAGGGTLLSFPAIMAAGVPALVADATNAVVVCPGFLGAVLAQRNDLHAYRHRLGWLLAASFAGGLTGGALLLALGERIFLAVVPFLLLAAWLLLAFQDVIRDRLFPPGPLQEGRRPRLVWSIMIVGLSAIYGGYFGAGMSVLLLAALGLTQEGSLKEINALKQPISLAANLAASLLFIISGRIVWPVAGVMAVGAIAGGYLGGRLAGAVRPSALRWTILILGGIVTAVYFLRMA